MRVLISAIFTVAAAILLIVLILTSIAPSIFIKRYINQSLEESIGIKAKCDSVEMSLLLGRGRIKGIVLLGNNEDPVFKISSLSFQTKISSAISNEIVIEKMRISGLEVDIIFDLSGKTSIIEILNSIKTNKSIKNLRIDDLIIDDFSVRGGVNAIGHSIIERSIFLPSIHLSSIGNESTGLDRIIYLVTESINNHILSHIRRSAKDISEEDIENPLNRWRQSLARIFE